MYNKGYWTDDDGYLFYGTGTADSEVVGNVNKGHRRSLGTLINNTQAINADNVNLRDTIHQIRPFADCYKKICQVLGIEKNILGHIKDLKKEVEDLKQERTDLVKLCMEKSEKLGNNGL